MAVHKLISAVHEELFEKSDDVVASWFVSNNPALIVGILGTYWMFVYKVGPTWMSNRKPYDPKGFIQAYNIVQVAVCLGMVVWPFTDADILKSVFSFGCSNCLPKSSDKYYSINRYAWWYLMIKLVDLLDTVFFVLRKKQNQITFLHVYHHMSVVLLALLYVRFTFSEHVPVLVFLNSLVHVFMYGYYFLAALGPAMQKRLWWKRYITTLQLVQFVLLMLVMAITLAFDCAVNKTTSVITIVYVSYFLYLFGRFYKRTYNNSTNDDGDTSSSKKAVVVVEESDSVDGVDADSVVDTRKKVM